MYYISYYIDTAGLKETATSVSSNMQADEQMRRIRRRVIHVQVARHIVDGDVGADADNP